MAKINTETLIENLHAGILKERSILTEISSLMKYMKNTETDQERKMVSSQIASLTKAMQNTGTDVISNAEKISLFRPLSKTPQTQEKSKEREANPSHTETIRVQEQNKKIPTEVHPPVQKQTVKNKNYPLGDKKLKADALEKLALKRMKKTDKKIVKKKEKKASAYVNLANKFFYNHSMKIINNKKFRQLRRDLVKSNLEIVPAAYISVIFFSTVVAFVASIFVAIFFLFFNVGAAPPFITLAGESMGVRALKVFWLLFAIPAGAFAFTYFYPGLEKKSLETRINQELPFAVIHMSSISGSMIEPSKIFGIIISTQEYPYLEKEFIMLQNEINIYGYDLVTALKNRSYNSPSKKLAELFNGLSTTITSGGNLPEFFEKRAQTLLFEHKLDKERQGKAAETFMDIYISVVIAAPMILMLLLIMMRLSGLGLSLSTGLITVIMVLGVSLINILFLTFLHLKQPEGA